MADLDLQHAFARLQAIMDAHEVSELRVKNTMGIWQVVMSSREGLKRGSDDVDLTRAFLDALNYYTASMTGITRNTGYREKDVDD